MDINLALHEAIAKSDTQTFHQLLHHSDVDINYTNAEGKTPLLASINRDLDSSMAMSLIRAGCDLQCRGRFGTPLHEAVTHNLIDVAHELLLHGAHINKKTGTCGASPLSYAIMRGNLKAVCLLLYYQVDVNIPSFGVTHLVQAVRANQNNICETLINYCDITLENNAKEKAVSVALYNENPFGIDLLKRGATVDFLGCWQHTATPSHNSQYEENDSPLHRAAERDNNELFKLIWFQCRCKSTKSLTKFLFWYINESANSKFSNFEWWECLHLMLKTLLKLNDDGKHRYTRERWVNYRLNRIFPRNRSWQTAQRSTSIGSTLWKLVLNLFHTRREPKDRLSIIYTWLNLGAVVKAVDLQFLHLLFGSNDEFEAIVYAGDLSYNDYKQQMRLLFKEPFNSDIPLVIYEEFVAHYEHTNLPQNRLCSLGFFSLSHENRRQYLAWSRMYMPSKSNAIKRKIDTIPQFPSLLELSRDQAIKNIEDNFYIVKAYQFYDAVKGLNLPQIVKDMILFKRPIY